ncbi:MAG: hypothetical protein LAO31_21405 [Acidobacteriia bacterium]|nr:hypothetical protein [Terriglobia bacterium]
MKKARKLFLMLAFMATLALLFPTGMLAKRDCYKQFESDVQGCTDYYSAWYEQPQRAECYLGAAMMYAACVINNFSMR